MRFTTSSPNEQEFQVKIRRNKPDFTRSANIIFQTLSPENQTKFYKTMVELNRKAWRINEQEPIIEYLKQLKEIIPYQYISQCVDDWINKGIIYIPVDLIKTYVNKRDGINSLEKTYVYQEYVELVKLGLWLQIIIPGIERLVEVADNISGDDFKDAFVINLIHRAWDIKNSEAYLKLEHYISSIENTNNNTILSNKISKRQILEKLISAELIKRLATNDYTNDVNIIATIFKYISNQQTFPGGEWSYIHHKTTSANEDNENGGTVTENVRVTENTLTIDIRVAHYFLMHNILSMFQLEETPALLNEMSTLKDQTRYLLTQPFHDGIYEIVKYMIGDEICVETKYINKETLHHTLVGLHLVFKQWGLTELSELIISVPIRPILFNSGTKIEYNEEKINDDYPFKIKDESPFELLLTEITTSVTSQTWNHLGVEKTFENIKGELIKLTNYGV